MSRRRGPGVILLLAALVGVAVFDGGWPSWAPWAPSSAVDAAWEAGRSDVWVEEAGVVVRVLPDDLDGSRHQRFILRLPSGRTVLVAHNIDLADRLEGLSPGDEVRFRGEYEWNRQGGVVHWTHHDPDGRHAGGWLEHRGRRVR